MQMTDDFIDTVVSHSCMLAKHRTSNTLEIKDVQLHLGKTSLWPCLYLYQYCNMKLNRALLEYVDSWFWF